MVHESLFIGLAARDFRSKVRARILFAIVEEAANNQPGDTGSLHKNHTTQQEERHTEKQGTGFVCHRHNTPQMLPTGNVCLHYC